MTRQAMHATMPSFPAAPPAPMHLPHLPATVPAPELAEQIDELLRLESCTVSMLRATRRRGELGGVDAMLAALEAEALHRRSLLTGLALQYGSGAAPEQAPLSPALAAASTSLA